MSLDSGLYLWFVKEIDKLFHLKFLLGLKKLLILGAVKQVLSTLPKLNSVQLEHVQWIPPIQLKQVLLLFPLT